MIKVENNEVHFSGGEERIIKDLVNLHITIITSDRLGILNKMAMEVIKNMAEDGVNPMSVIKEKHEGYEK